MRNAAIYFNNELKLVISEQDIYKYLPAEILKKAIETARKIKQEDDK
jgi:hypothetical protein